MKAACGVAAGRGRATAGAARSARMAGSKAGWPAADGQSVLGGVSKSFTVSPLLRTCPDMDLWTITAPARATQDPLRITFDRAFDNMLLQKDLWVAA